MAVKKQRPLGLIAQERPLTLADIAAANGWAPTGFDKSEFWQPRGDYVNLTDSISQYIDSTGKSPEQLGAKFVSVNTGGGGAHSYHDFAAKEMLDSGEILPLKSVGGYTTYVTKGAYEDALKKANEGGYSDPDVFATYFSRTPEQNKQAVETSREYYRAKADAEHSAFRKRLLGGTAGAFLALASPALLTGFGAASAAPAAEVFGPAVPAGLWSTAGSAAGSALGTFSGKAALGGAIKGGIGGLASGDGLSGVLKGAGLGSITGGFGGGLASSLGLSGGGASAFQGALTGASGGLANKDLKTAATGGALGGIGGYLSGGGLGTVAGSPVSDTVAGPTQGSGVLGALTRNIPGTSELVNGLTGSGAKGGNMNLLKGGANLFSAYQADKANSQVEEDLLKALKKSEGVFDPYLQTGNQANQLLADKLASGELGGTFNPGDLTQDPGYQFRLQQGQDALNRSLSARGGLFSGGALKAAQEYGQGLADTTYNDAYDRWLRGQNNTYGMLSGQANNGLNAAGSLADVYGNQGLVRANKALGRNNILSKTLSGLLGQEDWFNSDSWV